MKRHPWLEGLLLSSIFMLTVLIGIFILITGDSKYQIPTVSASSDSNADEENVTEKEIDEKAATETMSVIELPSDFEGIRLFKENSIDPTAPYSITYPKTNYEPLNKEISQYIETSKQQYSSAVKQHKNNNSLVKSNLRIQVNISQYKQAYYSIIFTKQETLDGKNIGETFQTIFFNAKTGAKIDSKTLLKKNVENLKKLSKYVHEKMLEPKGYKENISTKKWNIASYPYWVRYDRFTIENDSLVLYYNKSEFSNPIIGSPKIVIPLSFLNPILASEFQSETKSNITILTPKPTKMVALTFDDGPHKTITNQILNLLDKYNDKATFFMVGERVEGNASVVKDVLARGHEIGNHTWDHARLTKLSLKNAQSEISSTNSVIYKVTGQYPTVFRPPYGEKNKQVTDLVKVPVVLWTIDTLDWKYRDSSKLLPMIQKNIKNNAIILMHDIHQSTANGLESVLIYLQKEGYECVTVSELLASQK